MEYSVERIHSSTKAFGSGFMMLSSNMYSTFINYLLEGRVRAPPASELKELEPTFQDGARTDRRALQSKFKSWAKRMALVDGKLVMITTGKLIIPSECCEMVIKEIHFRNSECHLTIDEIVAEIQKTYSWNRKNFGMDWNIVANTLKEICKEERCLESLHVRLYRKTTSMTPTKDSPKLSVQNILSARRLYVNGEWKSFKPNNSLVPFPSCDISQMVPFRRQKFLKALKPKQEPREDSPTSQKKKDFLSALGLVDKQHPINGNMNVADGDSRDIENETAASDTGNSAPRQNASNTPFVLKFPTIKKEPIDAMEEIDNNQDDVEAAKKPAWQNVLINNRKYVIPVKVETTKTFLKVSEAKGSEVTPISGRESVCTVKTEADENNAGNNIAECSLETEPKEQNVYEKILNIPCSSTGKTPNSELEEKLKDLHRQVIENREKKKGKPIQRLLFPKSYQRMSTPLFRRDALKIAKGDVGDRHVLQQNWISDTLSLNRQKNERNFVMGRSLTNPSIFQSFRLATNNLTPFNPLCKATTNIKQEDSGKNLNQTAPLKKRILATYETELAKTAEKTPPVQPEEIPVDKKPRIWRPDPEIMEKETTSNFVFAIPLKGGNAHDSLLGSLSKQHRSVIGVGFPPTVPCTTLTTANSGVTPRVLTPKPLLTLPNVEVEEQAKFTKVLKKREKPQQTIFTTEDNIYDRMEIIRRLIQGMRPDIILSLADVKMEKACNRLDTKIDVALKLVQETKVHLEEFEEN